MTRALALAIALAVGSACATKKAAPRTCEPVPAEFSLPGQVVYAECAVDQKARPPATAPRLNYAPALRQTCARAIVDVVIDSAGHPVQYTARVVRASDPAFGVALLQSLPATRYQPAMKDGRPVAQLARIERGYHVTMVAVPAGASPSSVRPPRRPPPC